MNFGGKCRITEENAEFCKIKRFFFVSLHLDIGENIVIGLGFCSLFVSSRGGGASFVWGEKSLRTPLRSCTEV